MTEHNLRRIVDDNFRRIDVRRFRHGDCLHVTLTKRRPVAVLRSLAEGGDLRSAQRQPGRGLHLRLCYSSAGHAPALHGILQPFGRCMLRNRISATGCLAGVPAKAEACTVIAFAWASIAGFQTYLIAV